MSTTPPPGRRHNDAQDRAHLAAVAAGGRKAEKALEALFTAYRNRLLSFLKSQGFEEHEAEDALQEVFITVFTKAHTYKGDGAVSSWLFTIARHAALQRLRKQNKEQQLSEAQWDELMDTTPANTACPLEPDRAKAFHDCVSAAYAEFARANPLAAEMVFNQVWFEWSNADVARFLGINDGAVRQRLSDYKKKFRQFAERCRHLMGDAA